MSDRFFLDTNIFVYSFDRSAPGKREISDQLIRTAISSHKGVVSYQVVQEFFNVMFKRFAQPLRQPDAELYLSNVLRPMLSIHSSAALFRQALYVHSDAKISWYDSLIVSAAIQAECTTLFSEDLQHGQKIGSLTITNPFL